MKVKPLRVRRETQGLQARSVPSVRQVPLDLPVRQGQLDRLVPPERLDRLDLLGRMVDPYEPWNSNVVKRACLRVKQMSAS